LEIENFSRFISNIISEGNSFSDNLGLENVGETKKYHYE
jgi:hypothetical protein